MITIKKEDLDTIIEQARAEYPKEACGILAGRGNAIEKVYKMKNINNSSVSYEIGPTEQLRCEKEIKDAGLKIICIYHSHPSSQAYPSQVDMVRVYWPGDPDMPIYPDAYYMIIGPVDGKTEIKVFKIYPGQKVDEIKLDIKRG